jgi:hypothetical protein
MAMQLTLWAQPITTLRSTMLASLKASDAVAPVPPKTALLINKGSGIRQVHLSVPDTTAQHRTAWHGMALSSRRGVRALLFQKKKMCRS